MLIEEFDFLTILDSEFIHCYRLHLGYPNVRIGMIISEDVLFQHSSKLWGVTSCNKEYKILMTKYGSNYTKIFQ